MGEFINIKNYETFSINKKGEVKDLRTGKYKDQFKNIHGYSMVNLQNPNGWKAYFVHRLVGETFIEKVEGCNEIDHIDRNKDNNDISNLRWANDIIQNNNKCGWGNIKEKYITFEKTNGSKKNPYSCWVFQIRSQIYGSHKKRFRSDKYTLQDAIDYKNEYFKKVQISS